MYHAWKKSLKGHKINCVQWLFGGVKLRYWSSEVGERLTYLLMEFYHVYYLLKYFHACSTEGKIKRFPKFCVIPLS